MALQSEKGPELQNFLRECMPLGLRMIKRTAEAKQNSIKHRNEDVIMKTKIDVPEAVTNYPLLNAKS